MIGLTHFPMHIVQDQNIYEVTVTDGSTVHMAVTTPCTIIIL